MTLSFRGKLAPQIWEGRSPNGFPPDLVERAESKLALIDAATDVNDLRVPPGNRLEKLSGDREGQWSLRINRQWRVCFRWEDGHAHDVEIVDYH